MVDTNAKLSTQQWDLLVQQTLASGQNDYGLYNMIREKVLGTSHGLQINLKHFISSCGTHANLVCQAKSRQKILDKMEANGLLTMPYEEPMFRFKFADAGTMAAPLIFFSEVAFSYSGLKKDCLFKNISSASTSSAASCWWVPTVLPP